jgi:glucose-1-phosphate cytidylyltransferase
MKVVLFCGGMGMRLRDYSENVPKPMISIGYRPILWHIMKYYAHFGHKEFILCLGYRADTIKDYFLQYSECVSNDFTLLSGGKAVKLYNSDIHDWNITFVDTGVTSNIGQRLVAVQKYLEDDEIFLANYSDGLTDMSLPEFIDMFERSGKIASFLAVKPNLSYHAVTLGPEGVVTDIQAIANTDFRINGGYFVLRQEIFEHIHEGEELVVEPFQRLIARKQLLAYPYQGFFATMDTFKDKMQLDELYAKGRAPWEVWKSANGGQPSHAWAAEIPLRGVRKE